MKNLYLFVVIFLFSPFALHLSVANAATLSLSPTTVAATQGQNVILTITLNPEDSTIYSAKIQVRYPSELLQFVSFNIGSGWTHASADDVTDQSRGIFRRTAGYPNPGLSSQTAVFGTISFLAKASGTGAISITADSAAYDGSISNVLSGVPVQASIAIQEPIVPPPTPTPTSPPAPAAEEPEEELEVEEEEVLMAETETEEPAEEEQVPQGSLLAAVGDIISLGTGNVFAGISFLVVLVGLIGYVLFNRFQKKRSSKNRL